MSVWLNRRSIRHTTRNFPSREGSKPGNGQLSGVAPDLFDIPGFGADYAYTLDGGYEAEVVYENFNACGAEFQVNGVNIHPGEAKDRMVNASIVAMEINSMLPACERPEHT